MQTKNKAYPNSSSGIGDGEGEGEGDADTELETLLTIPEAVIIVKGLELEDS